MTTVLVANRGEVAVRVLRTVRRMGLRGAAVFSDADAESLFVRMADVSVRIGEAPAAKSYLSIGSIIEAALDLGASLVHPGYGFLSEDHRFAAACEKAGLVFIGPTSDVLKLMGAKDEAKRLAEQVGAPVLPGSTGEDGSDDSLARAASEIGYPVIIKPVAGGGGKGMAVVETEEGLQAALASARRTSVAAFDDDRVMIEKYLQDPRHVEVQILADSHGNIVHLGERDCSAQRRHQKVMEETPSPFVDDVLRERLTSAAVAIGKASAYRSAGTCEFIVGSDGTPAFMEMNARLQVEHPVTEMVTGIDLVEQQIRIAMGEALTFQQSDIVFTGHSAEVRLYAEDPETGFLPQAGSILHLKWPEASEGVRIDTGVEEGSEITAHYDPMVAKVICRASDRAACLEMLSSALAEIEILGLRTNLSFLQMILRRPEVASGSVTTSLLEGLELTEAQEAIPDEVLLIAAAAESARITGSPVRSDPWSALGPWRLGGSRGMEVIVRANDEEIGLQVDPAGGGSWFVAGKPVQQGAGVHSWLVEGRQGAAVRELDAWLVWWDGHQYTVPIGPRLRTADPSAASHLGAPMPGQVLAVKVRAGEPVKKGQVLVVVEAMKMEHAVKAPSEGVVKAVLCAEGDQVDRGATLVDIEPA